MSIFIALFVIVIVVGGAVVAAGDLRITRKQQREWEEYWESLSPGEREWQGYLTHHIPGYGRERTREDFGP